jgi:hypothetical protein
MSFTGLQAADRNGASITENNRRTWRHPELLELRNSPPILNPLGELLMTVGSIKLNISCKPKYE